MEKTNLYGQISYGSLVTIFLQLNTEHDKKEEEEEDKKDNTPPKMKIESLLFFPTVFSAVSLPKNIGKEPIRGGKVPRLRKKSVVQCGFGRFSPCRVQD